MELNGQIQNGGSLNGSFGYDSGDYELLSHKPQINGVTLIGNKTSADLHIEGGGTDDYNELDNKPMINGVQLTGNKTPEELGLAEIIYPDDPTLYLNGAGEFTEPAYFSGDYDDLTDKPQINGVTLSGDKSTSDILIDYDDLSGRPKIDGTTLTGDKTPQEIGCEPTINYPGDATQYLNGEGNFTTPEYFSGDYDDLTDKPQINGVTLSGNLDTGDLEIDYDDISGRPSINSIILTGNKSGNDLKLTSGAIASGSGTSVTFEAAEAYNLLKCIVDIEPIQSGSGTPSPDNPRPINGYTEIKVDVAGKNLCRVNSGNNVVVAHCIAGQTYTFSIRNQGNCGFNLKKNNSAGEQIARQDASTSTPLYLTFTADEDFDLFLNGFGSGGLSFSGSAYDYQLELGSDATTYVSYVGSTTATALGQTVYGGQLNVITGELVIDRQIMDLGDLTWNINNHQTLGTYFYSDITSYNFKYEGNFSQVEYDTISSQYSGTKRSPTYFVDGTFCFDGQISTEKVTQIQIKDARYNNASDFETAMEGVQLCYKIDTPQTVQLTPQTIAGIIGDNYIIAEGNIIMIEAATEIYDPIIKYLVNNR